MKTLKTSLLFATGILFGLAAQAEDTATTPPPAVQKESATPASTPAPAPQTPKAKPAKTPKPRFGTPRAKDMDLRHCLERPTNAEIAACAGE